MPDKNATKSVKAKIPEHCKGCRLLWTYGKKDGVHNCWCPIYGKAAVKAATRCKTEGRKEAFKA